MVWRGKNKGLPTGAPSVGSFELELPDGLEEQIDTHLKETSGYLSKSELVRDAVRRFLEDNADGPSGNRIYLNSQHISTLRTESLKDVKAEHEWGGSSPTTEASKNENDNSNGKDADGT